MQQTMEQIAHILEEELNIYRELVQVSDRLTDVILNGEIKELDEILNVQQAMIITLGKLEEERMKSMGGLWKDNLVITDLIKEAEGELSYELEGLLEDLLATIEEQKRLNDINSKLLKTNLEYVEFALGTVAGNKSVNLFDQKA